MPAKQTSHTVTPTFRRVRTNLGTKINWDKPGQMFTGTYRGIGELVMPEHSENAGEIAQYVMLEAENGQEFFCWLATELKTALSQVEPGALVQITFQGREAIRNGAQQVNHFEVLVAD